MKIYFEVDKEYYTDNAHKIEEVIPLYLLLKCHVNTNLNDPTGFFKNGLLVAWPSFIRIKNSLHYGQNKISRLLKKLVEIDWIHPIVGKKEYRNYYQLGTHENGKFEYFSSKNHTQDEYEIVPITEQTHTQIGPYPNRTIPILNQTRTQNGANSYPFEKKSYPNLYLKNTISITKKETEKYTANLRPDKADTAIKNLDARIEKEGEKNFERNKENPTEENPPQEIEDELNAYYASSGPEGTTIIIE